MSNNDWYNDESWYAPLAPREEEPQSKPAKKKKKTRIRVIGAVCLALLLLIGTSIAFREPESKETSSPSIPSLEDSDDMPENWQDFFDDYYESVQTDVAEINIPRAELPIDFRLELQAAPEEELSLQELYQNCSPSIVAICGYVDGKSAYSWGTGVVLSEDGLILTNTHVIEDCDRATVTLYDDSVHEATLVGADAISDVAVLKIEATGLAAASFGDSGSLMVGDRVAAIGNPLGETFRMTLTDGIISAIERGINYNGHSMTLLQTNTALNEGNSGGPLFNMYGQVVGVTNMKMMSSYSSIEGIGFAIPSATVKSVVNALVADGEVRGRPSVGITIGGIPDNASDYYSIPGGVYVSDVTEGSDAEAKGIQAGDIITHVNGQPVSTIEEVGAIKNQFNVGDVMSFTIWRQGETFDVDVVLMDTNDIYGK
ncbi:MAG: S1C family serine protease [Candidatus Limivicinus sp.]